LCVHVCERAPHRCLLWHHGEFSIEDVVPDLLHVLPVIHQTPCYRARDVVVATAARDCRVTHVVLLLAKVQPWLPRRPSHDVRHNAPWGVIPGIAHFERTRTQVAHQRRSGHVLYLGNLPKADHRSFRRHFSAWAAARDAACPSLGEGRARAETATQIHAPGTALGHAAASRAECSPLGDGSRAGSSSQNQNLRTGPVWRACRGTMVCSVGYKNRKRINCSIIQPQSAPDTTQILCLGSYRH
jgi:hypothetical protein